MIYSFDRFQADDDVFRLTAEGRPLSIEPKALRLLLYLIQNRGRLVRKQELLNAVWGDTAVGESALTRSVGLLRKTLEDDSREPRFIETVPTAGYRFIATVEVIPPAAAKPDPSPQVIPPSAPIQTSAPTSRRTLIALGGLALLILLAFLAVRILRPPQRSIHSLAVLPLDNLSGDPSQDYFADGMTDDLITEIARIPNLRVVSRTSVVSQKNSHKSLPEIARELDVDAIVEGSTVRSGDRVRITAQLIDGRTDRHLWADSFQGSATDVLSLQDSVARQIAQQARLVVSPAPPHPAINPAAYEAYLRGRYFFNKQDFPHSVQYYQQALSIDPNFASAYAGYANALEGGSIFGYGAAADVMPRAFAAAQHAIQLDPQNGEAYTELGSLQTTFYWDWTAAGQNLTRGIALNPNDSMAEFKYAVYLDAVGRLDDAVVHMRRAVTLDPLSFIVSRRLGASLYYTRDYDAALAQFNRAAEMENQPNTVEGYIAMIYEKKGQYAQAVDHTLIALHSEHPEIDIEGLRSVFQHQGWQAFIRATIKALLSTPPTPSLYYVLAQDEVRINNFGQAFFFLNRAADEHSFHIALVKCDPALDPIRSDPRYAVLLHRLHFN